jgi:DNA mismatch repair protein MutS2
MLRLAEEEVEAALKQVRHSKLQPAELEKIRQTLRAARSLVSVEPSRLQAESAPDLHVGDTVQIGEGGPIGRLTSIRDSEAQVLIGTMSVSSKLANLILRDDLHPAQHPRSSGGRSAANLEKAMTAQAELNIIAKHADEAESDVEKFLNDSLMSGLSPVRIVHGRGTGALRKLVRQIAKEHPQVLRFYHPPLDQGGDAVTVLEFK